MTDRDPRLLTAEQLEDIADMHWDNDVPRLLDHIDALTERLRLIRDTYSLASVRGPSLAARLVEIAETVIGDNDGR